MCTCSHINTFLSKHNKSEFELEDIDIDKLIEDIDPKLWEMVCVLTKSGLTSRSKINDPSSQSYHTKKIRRFFILNMLMFCINEKYTIPLHILLTDLVEGQGGSSMLIKILNQLGVCASADTLARYIQQKHSNRTPTIESVP